MKNDYTVPANPLNEIKSPPKTELEVPFTLVSESELDSEELKLVENWENEVKNK